ncbi:DUF3137 domain-containing protein [Algoriphagus sp. D3-2-R+10]|uniref:DUF3137 domain-containing protein n=1 Tax=Algoriphagus aurantiacus TaxID=3103948 RepID=UPI002B3F57F7|nr:DUF3137 domain-containing protein [Algoriphagus sp. D3-2-R+10]MEB2777376.1 DUF3137 domain-containing protein [Algoriphagus sp. D3-2-R+10]
MEPLLIRETFSEVQKSLIDIHLQRKRTLLFLKIMWGITGIYFLGMLLMLGGYYFPALAIPFSQILPSPSKPYTQMYLFMGLMVLIYVSSFYFVRIFQKLKIAENNTMAKMAQRLFPELEFTQGANAPKKEILNSNLFAWVDKDSHVVSFGQLRSKSKTSEINLADIGILEKNLSNTATDVLLQIPLLNMLVALYQYIVKNLLSNVPKDSLNYSFRGMFCWLRFQKKLIGHTVVIPRNQNIKIDRWASFNFRDEEQVHLEDPRFTEEFIVYGTDQVEARYVISTALMERISALKSKFNRPIFLSFQDRQMYLAVKNENGLFSFTSENLNSLSVVEELTSEIETALNIAKDLRLSV